MLRKLAYVVSALFHPILLPTWVMVVLIANGQLASGGYDNVLTCNYFLTNFAVTFLFPLIAFAVLKKKKAINSFELETRSERLLPLIIMSVFFYTAYYIFRNSLINVIYIYFMLCAVLLCALACAITMRWKISLHGLGWGTFLACLSIMTYRAPDTYLPWLCVSIIVAGIVASARLYMRSHTPSQVYVGFAVGFVVGMIPLFVMI